MIKLLIVGAGGFLGAISRYTLSGIVHRWVPGAFPIGTLCVNLIGCFLIGALMTLVQDRKLFTPEARLLFGVGILGSLTTFSTFGYETVELMRGGESRMAFLSVAANVVLGVAGVILGRFAVKVLGV
ncbi:MAG: fluoride efflux transporter CrcB [Planctomycetota bacterium]